MVEKPLQLKIENRKLILKNITITRSACKSLVSWTRSINSLVDELIFSFFSLINLIEETDPVSQNERIFMENEIKIS